MHHRVYHRQIQSVDKLKRLLIDVWCGLEQSIFDEAIDQWRRRHRVCIPHRYLAPEHGVTLSKFREDV